MKGTCAKNTSKKTKRSDKKLFLYNEKAFVSMP